MTAEADTRLVNQPAGNRRHDWQRQDWYLVGILLLVSCLILLPALNSFGLIDPGDAFYPEAAREMLERGDFLTPYLNYVPMFEKPILIYWLIIGCYKIFGVAEWVGRIPSVISALATVLALFYFSRCFLRRRAAFIAALVLLTSPLFALIGHLALTDMLLTCCTTISLLCLLRRTEGGGIPSLLIGCVALGLAILTKGPLALVLIALVMLTCQAEIDWLSPALWWRLWGRWVTLVTLVAALALQGPVAGALFVVSALSYLASLNLQPKLCLHAWLRKNPAGDLLLAVLVVGAVVLPWFVAESVITQGRFFYEFIIRENFGRLSGTVNHQNPFVWFYIPFLLAGFFPWIFLLIPGTGVYRALVKVRKQPDGSQKLAQYASCWLIVVVVLFTLVSTKLPTYILPALPPWAVLTGLILDRWIAAKNYKSVTGLCGCVAALSWIGCCALGYFVYVHTPLLSNPTVNVVLAAGVAVLAITSSWALLAALQKKLALSVYALLGGYACFVACFMPAALIINDAQLQQPLRSLVATAGRAHGSLSTFLRDSHAAVYYLKARVPLLLNEPQYEQFVRTQPAPHFTLTPVNLLPVLQARIPNVRVLARSSKWALCSLDAEHK